MYKVKISALTVLLVTMFAIRTNLATTTSTNSAYLTLNNKSMYAPLNGKVVAYRDDWGVPHIYAQEISDAYFALGYMMAEDRLFEMDLFRRAVSGRLGEIFGDLMFEDDIIMRTLGVYQIALDTWNGLYPD